MLLNPSKNDDVKVCLTQIFQLIRKEDLRTTQIVRLDLKRPVLSALQFSDALGVVIKANHTGRFSKRNSDRQPDIAETNH